MEFSINMSNTDNNLYCRICWYKHSDTLWWKDWKTSIFELCSCCWVEFWYEDSTIKGIKTFRQKWMDEWYQWFIKKEKPDNWSFENQKKNIMEAFL